ncbi:HTH-like domain-containing protein [Bacillus cereus group sp. TH254-2LC]
MSIAEIGAILWKMYTNTADKDQATFIHLFGIKYGELI